MFDASVREEVIAAYRRGDKLSTIEHEFGVARATIYWFLEQAGIGQRRQLRGDSQTVRDLYAIILEQEEYISAQDEELAALRAALEAEKRRK